MAKFIIGIHGMENQPLPQVLKKWWEMSMLEGLVKNCQVRDSDLPFELVYWATRVHKNPLHHDASFQADKLFDKEPYMESGNLASRPREHGWLDEVGPFFTRYLGLDKHVDARLAEFLGDLNVYFDKGFDCQRKEIRRKITDLLQPNDRNYMIIAHAMGSVVAYEALIELESSMPDFKVSHFVTIGSPLGLPPVKANIIGNPREKRKPRIPENIAGRWINFADRRDPLTLDTSLKDDFAVNSYGVSVEDNLIDNDYMSPSTGRNYSKSYGYLRTPKFSKILLTFLEK